MTKKTALVMGLAALSMQVACGGDGDGGAKSAKPTATAAPDKAATTDAKPAKADAPAAPAKGDAPPAPADAPAEKAGAHSPVPTVAEWQAVTGEVTVRGSSALGCETKGLREWVRVSCRGDDPGRGSPLNVTVNDAKGAETFTFASGGVASLVYRFEEGTRIKASFAWTNAGKAFVAEWPAGAPKPTAYGVFVD